MKRSDRNDRNKRNKTTKTKNQYLSKAKLLKTEKMLFYFCLLVKGETPTKADAQEEKGKKTVFIDNVSVNIA